MLDPRLIRDRPGVIKSMLAARAVDYDLDGLVGALRRRRECIEAAGALRMRRNKLGAEIARAKKGGGDASGPIAEMREVSAGLESAEADQSEAEARYARLAMSVPNMIDPSVPVGTADANLEVRRWGGPQEPGFRPRDHIDISTGLGLVDLERAAKVAGSRFYYLRDGLVRLNQALISHALDYASKLGYLPVQPPYMINRESMQGAVIAADFEDVIYRIEGEDLYMIGTSEHAMAAMHSDEIIEAADLPLRYAGTSPCFRKEAGVHGRDEKGIFRVHQFEKIEMFTFARPDESAAEHERMLDAAEGFYRGLGLPHRVVLLSSQDMGKVSAKTYDIEAWMAGQKAYREVVSCSNCLDYQARRLGVRFRESTDAQTQLLHTLNSTLVATTRTMIAIMEGYQTADGHVQIPPVLRPYMGGQTAI